MDYTTVAVEAVKVIGAFVLGVLGTYLAVRFQRKRRLIQHSELVFPLVRFKTGDESGLKVLADRSLLSGDPADHGQSIPIENLSGVSIRFDNVGNEVAENLTAEIHLQEEARILQIQTSPVASEGYNVDAHRVADALNLAVVLVPFLNPKQRLLVAITAADLPSDSKVGVQVLGKGIEVRRRMFLPRLLWFVVVGSVFAGLAGLLASPNFVRAFPPAVLNAVGARLVPADRVVWAWWSQILFAGLAIFVIARAFLNVVRDEEPPPPWHLD